MIVLLMIMTPGIPEYLTGSSNFGAILFDTPQFFISLILNISLYTTGALLIREFSIKYGKGWATILILGLAYGIMEEGISVHTFFLPAGNPVSLLGVYGRYLGVDWIWALGISFFHAIFSIGLPLLLLSVAYPKHSSERLFGKKGVIAVLGIYALDVVVLNLLLLGLKTRPMPTIGDYIFFLILAAILVLVAKVIPNGIFQPHGKSERGKGKLLLLGLLVFPLYDANAFLPFNSSGSPRIPPVLEAILYIIGNILLGLGIARYMPRENNRSHKFSLAVGLIIPLLFWAEFVQVIGIANLITIVTIIAIIFLFRLRSMINEKKDSTAVSAT